MIKIGYFRHDFDKNLLFFPFPGNVIVIWGTKYKSSKIRQDVKFGFSNVNIYLTEQPSNGLKTNVSTA